MPSQPRKRRAGLSLCLLAIVALSLVAFVAGTGKRNPARRSLREVLLEAADGGGGSVELLKDAIERSVRLCTGSPLEQWQASALAIALEENTGRQTLVPDPQSGSAQVVLDVSGDALRALESVLGSVTVDELRPCLTEQLIGAPPKEAQQRQLIFNVLDTAVIDCGQPKIGADAEQQLWEAFDHIYTSVEGEKTEDGVSFKLMVDIELLEVVAEAVAKENDRMDRNDVDTLRWCMQSILSGGPITLRTPLIAQRLIEAAQYSCTLTTFDEHEAREEWERMQDRGAGDLVGFYEYSDGIGGSSGTGRMRITGRYPLDFLQDEFVPVVLGSNSTAAERDELFQCLLTIFDGGGILGPEEVAIFVDMAHSVCSLADRQDDYGYGTTSQEFQRLTRAMVKHDIAWGSHVLGPGDSLVPKFSDEDMRRRLMAKHSGGSVLEYWLEVDLAFLADSISILWPNDPKRGMELLPCYKTEIEGQYSDQLSNPEWALLYWVAPQCYPVDTDEDTAGLILEGYIRPRNHYRNGTLLVSTFELPDEALFASTGLKANSPAAQRVPACIVASLQGESTGWQIGSSAALASVFHQIAAMCAREMLLEPEWEQVAASLQEFVPELNVTVLVDGNSSVPSMGDPVTKPWWEAHNVSVRVNLPYGAVSAAGEVQQWPFAPADTPACLEAVVAGEDREGVFLTSRHKEVHDSESSGLGKATTAAIAGAVAAACVALALIGAFSWWLTARDKRQKSTANKYVTSMSSLSKEPTSFSLKKWASQGMYGYNESLEGHSEPLVRGLLMTLMGGSRSTAASLSSSDAILRKHDAGKLSPAGAWVLASRMIQLMRLKLGIISHVIQQRKERDNSAGSAIPAQLLGNCVDSTGNALGAAGGHGSKSMTLEWRIAKHVEELQALGPDYDINFETELRPHIGMKLGEGAYGSVFRGMYKDQPVAIKIVRPEHFQGQDGSRALKSFVKEVQIMSQYRDHDNIVKLLGACLRRPHIAIVYELMTLNLHSRIHSPLLPPLTPSESLRILRDVAEGLARLHPNTVHRDLKPQNILLDANGKAKIADFGLSRQVMNPLGTTMGTQNTAGTPLYMSPEAFNGQSKHTKGDIYALGIIMNECLTRKVPFYSKEYEHAFQIIYHVTVQKERPELATGCPEDLKTLITRCWSHDPELRPNIQEVKETLAHLWDTYFAAAAMEAERWTGGKGRDPVGSLTASEMSGNIGFEKDKVQGKEQQNM